LRQSGIITALLEAIGHHVHIVGSGFEAVEALGRAQYDVVLMDIQMPELDGISATKLIRALPAPANSVPVVALTANAMIGDREKYLAAGMNDYVSKPINVVELTSALRRQCATASFQS
jgi:CheY-like chemotaxis protein